MKETKNQLMSVFVSGTVLPLMIVCIYETEVVVPGLLATDKQSEFLLTFLMELMTLGCAFLALRLFKFEKIHQELISVVLCLPFVYPSESRCEAETEA